ncbi:MAG TPA: hypothetical protein VLA04_05545 [Verrucomicrobiae bacterium]|nr:hypothetical protein [Verrucomicrobiae bacterium]
MSDFPPGFYIDNPLSANRGDMPHPICSYHDAKRRVRRAAWNEFRKTSCGFCGKDFAETRKWGVLTDLLYTFAVLSLIGVVFLPGILPRIGVLVLFGVCMYAGSRMSDRWSSAFPQLMDNRTWAHAFCYNRLRFEQTNSNEKKG